MACWKGTLGSSNVGVKENGFLESKKQSKEAETKPSFADLPLCLLEVIISQLVLKDNIRASATCKTWREAGLYVRLVDKPPWLIYLPKRGTLIELFDPLQQKMYTKNLPELAKSTVCYSRDGWLLMRKTASKEMFFFSPFTRKLINLPKCNASYDLIAFSCAPTTSTCLVLAFKHVEHAIITTSTCHPGDTEWITEELPFHNSHRNELKHSNVVYANRRFYCLDGKGNLYYFDPFSREWSYDVYRFYTGVQCPYISSWWLYERKKKRLYLAVRKGVFFKIITCGGEKPMVYKLDSSKHWEEINSTTFDGLTIFPSLYSSETRVNLPWMRNSVYFPRLRFACKRCVSYSFDEERFYPRKQWQEQEDLCPVENLWIRPPKKALNYM